MNDKMPRREFTRQSVLALLGGVVITITGCNDTSSPTSPSATPTPSPSSSPGDVSGAISANHGHVATVTGVQIAAGNAVILDIMGNADHNHRVELSAGEIGQIGARQRVAKQSSTDLSHSHTVTFN